MTPEVLLQACEDGSIGSTYECFGTICGTVPVSTDDNFDCENRLQHALLHALRLHCMPTNTAH